MNKHTKYILIGLLICLQSCSLQDDTLPSGQFNQAELLDFMPAAMTQLAFNHSAIPGRTFAGFMHYFTALDSRIQLFNFNNNPDYFDDIWSSGYYGGSLALANEMKKFAIDSADPMAEAISLIIMAIDFYNLTNTFGDIPFSEALLASENITPRYDSQESVYQGVLQMLDDAIALIGTTGTEERFQQSDLIFQGDMQSWRKLANGLKARFLLSQRNRVPGREGEILSLIEASFDSRDQQAVFKHSLERPNPLYTFGEERPGTLVNSEFFVDVLLSNEDPRLEKFTVSNFPRWEYFGEPQLIWSRVDSEIPILSYTELQFIKAEALYHNGASKDDIQAALIEAVQSNFLDNEFVIENEIDSFIESVTNLDDLEDEQILKRIIEQAYVSYYGFNFLQSWTNYRRTGFPELPELSEYDRENNPSDIIPRRLRYPQSEIDYNNINVQDAINRQNGDLLDDDIWVFGG